MKPNDTDIEPMHEPLAALERELVAAYVAGTGNDLDVLRARDDVAAHKLLSEASLYASSRLSEVEARLHYLRAIRGEV
jgi:hypothetical protein